MIKRNSADAEIARHASRWDCGSQDYKIPVGLGMQMPIPTFCCTTVCDHNPPTLQTYRRTDRQTDGQTSCS